MSMAGWYLVIKECGKNVSRETLKKEDVEMTVRQYIGARYVPKYFENPDGTNDWLQGIAYEPLTIVTYAGNTFTSKVPVPSTVGTPNLNTDYWVITNSGGGGVTPEILDQINKNTSDITDINNEITDINQQIENIETKTDKYLIIGDSYTNIINDNNKNAFTVACEMAGFNVNDYTIIGKGGMGIAFGDTQLLPWFQAESESITNKESYTKIVWLGGANDMLSTNADTLNQAIQTFISWTKQNYINAEVCIGFLSKTYLNGNQSNSGIVLNCYKNCVKYGGTYLNGTEYIVSHIGMLQDYVHPYPKYVDEIGMYLAEILLTGNTNVHRSITVNWQILNADSTGVVTGIVNKPTKIVQENGVAMIGGLQDRNFLCQLNISPKTSNSLQWTEGLGISDTFMMGSSSSQLSITCMALYNVPGEGFKMGSAYLNSNGSYKSGEHVTGFNVALYEIPSNATEVLLVGLNNSFSIFNN